MFIKPAEGLKVRRPEPPHQHLPAEGAEVPDHDIYWHRRLNAGEVVLVKKAAGETGETSEYPAKEPANPDEHEQEHAA